MSDEEQSSSPVGEKSEHGQSPERPEQVDEAIAGRKRVSSGASFNDCRTDDNHQPRALDPDGQPVL